jgi:hypothetical protein
LILDNHLVCGAKEGGHFLTAAATPPLLRRRVPTPHRLR